MPGMPRTSSKATKIFYKILGKPAQDQPQRNTKRREKLVYEDSKYIR